VKPSKLEPGLRVCAYWSPQYSGLYAGRISSDYDEIRDTDSMIPIEFDDGDTGLIKEREIRLLATNHPFRGKSLILELQNSPGMVLTECFKCTDYDPNPLLTLEKKQRRRRNSSGTNGSHKCTGDHEEPDCGESYCVKMGKLDDLDFIDKGSKMLYWTWTGLGHKKPKSKKNRNREYFDGIQRDDQVIQVGDAALFISTGNDRPFIGILENHIVLGKVALLLKMCLTLVFS